MKKQTQPYLTRSIIQWKDGSTHAKQWLLYKSVLYLESNSTSSSFVKKNDKIQKKTNSYSKVTDA